MQQQNLLLYDMPTASGYYTTAAGPTTTTTTTTTATTALAAAAGAAATAITKATTTTLPETTGTYELQQLQQQQTNDIYNNNNNSLSLWELTKTALSSTLATFSERLHNAADADSDIHSAYMGHSNSTSTSMSISTGTAAANEMAGGDVESAAVDTARTLAPTIGRHLQEMFINAATTYSDYNNNHSDNNNNNMNSYYNNFSANSASSSWNQSIAMLMNAIAINTTNNYYNNNSNNSYSNAFNNYYNNNYNNNNIYISNHTHGYGAMNGGGGVSGAGGITEIPYVPYVMRPETYIVPVLFALIFIVGVLGNGTLIVVFLSVRQMRNVPNTYILSLALADLLVIVTTVPLTSTVYTVDTWPWGSFLCTLSEFIKDVSIGVSVFTLTALSADRYFAIVDPLRKFHAHGGGKRATRMTIAIAVSIWIMAIICGLPALLGTYIKEIKINSSKSFSICYPFPEQWGKPYAKTMVLLRFLVYYAIPLIIIGAFYVLIACHLMYSANVPGEMQGAVRQVRARRKVAVTVLAFVVIFGICFLPSHVFMLWFYYWPSAEQDYNSFWHVLRIIGFCMSFANSCANPVALYFVSGAFRKHFNRYLFCQDGGPRHMKRHHQHNDTLCMHRDASLTSTNASMKRCYHSRRSHHNHSTIRSRLAETTITMTPNGNNVDCPSGGYHSEVTAIAVTAVSDKPLLRRESKQQRLKQQQQQHDEAFM